MASPNRITPQPPQTSEPDPIAPALDHPFLNSTQRSGVEFKRERSRLSWVSNAKPRASGPSGGVWGRVVPNGVQGRSPGGGVQGCVRTHPWRSFGARSPEMLKRSSQITQHRSSPIPLGCVQHPRCVARWDNSTLPKSMRHQNAPSKQPCLFHSPQDKPRRTVVSEI
jgi:hypothetical protein